MKHDEVGALINKPCLSMKYFWSVVNYINSNDNIASSTEAHLSILVTNLLSFILFLISDSTSYFGNDGYMSLMSRLANCSALLKFSSFMFSTKSFDSLIKHFSGVAMCRYDVAIC